MGEVRPIPTLGGVVRDVRGAGRALRVSWHREAELVVLSLWDGPRCTGTVRVAAADVPALIEALQIGMPPEPVQPPADASDESVQPATDATPQSAQPTEATPQSIPPSDATPQSIPPADATP